MLKDKCNIILYCSPFTAMLPYMYLSNLRNEYVHFWVVFYAEEARKPIANLLYMPISVK